MAFNLANNPFMMGYMQDQTQRSDKRAVEQKDDSSKRREELVKMFDNDIKIVRDNLSKATDPKQREAIQSVLAQMKDAYGGAAAKEFGLDQQFSRTIDFAMQTPIDMTGSGTVQKTPEQLYEESKMKSRGTWEGKAEIKTEVEAPKLLKQAKTTLDSVTSSLEQIKLVKDEIKKNPMSVGGAAKTAVDIANTPYIGGLTSSSKANVVNTLTDQIKSNIAINTLAQIKKDSPNGASGFGQLAIREFDALMNTLAALNTGMEDKDFITQLDKVEKHYTELQKLLKEDIAKGERSPVAGRGNPAGEGMNYEDIPPVLLNENDVMTGGMTAQPNNDPLGIRR